MTRCTASFNLVSAKLSAFVASSKLAGMLAILCACGMASTASAGLLIYEPFDYTPAGAAIAGQTNTYSTGNPVWNEAGTATTPVHQVAAGSLAAPTGFPASIGNSGSLQQVDNTEYDRMNLDQSYGPNSTLYYSVLINVPSLDGLTTLNTNVAANNGVFIGFNNGMGAQGTRPSVWAGALTIRLNTADNTNNPATGYQLGLRSGAHSGGQSNNTFWTQDLTPGQTYLAVVRYTSGATAFTGGESDIWIDPNSSTFGAAVAPTPDGSHAGHMVNSGTDAAGSLLVGAGISTGFDPNVINIDEIRVGATWADVTSQTVPEPASVLLLTMGSVLAVTGMRQRKSLMVE